MQQRQKSQDHLLRSTSRSPLTSPSEEGPDPFKRRSTVAFVPFDVNSSSGVSSETRKAVRIQAAKASAAARKRTIARKIALQNPAIDESSSASAPESDRGRSLSATSSLQSGFLNLTTSPTPSPSRSVSVGQLEPFKPYPISQWHPQVPALVDHFLKYFAPENATRTPGRDALRKTIWAQALDDTALFHAILLNIGSHACVSGALRVPTELLTQLKHSTIESVNDAIARSEAGSGIGDPVIGAIALLGGWELEYGDAATYDTHMRGLETIVNLRGGLYGAQSPYPGYKALSSETVDLILAAGHDLAQYASKDPYFAEHSGDVAGMRPTAIPTGFASLSVQRLLLPSLVDPVSRIAHIVPVGNEFLVELAHIEQALDGRSVNSMTKASYSPFQTGMEDNLKSQVSSHVRLAGLVICHYLKLTTGSGSHDSLRNLYEEALRLQPEVVIGTLYEEVTFWALFMVCSLTGHCETKHMRTLKRLSLELCIEDWGACRQALSRYAYSSAILDGRAYALWEAVSSSTVAREASKGKREPNRFVKGIQHPTIYVGRAIVAEEG